MGYGSWISKISKKFSFAFLDVESHFKQLLMINHGLSIMVFTKNKMKHINDYLYYILNIDLKKPHGLNDLHCFKQEQKRTSTQGHKCTTKQSYMQIDKQFKTKQTKQNKTKKTQNKRKKKHICK